MNVRFTEVVNLIRSSRLLGVMALILLASFGAQAQADDDAVLFHGTRGADSSTTGGELMFVGSGETRTLPLPSALFGSGSTVTDLALSPDQSTLAVVSQPVNTDRTNPVALYNLSDDGCCVSVPLPIADVAAVVLGGFSPDGTQLALSWVGFIDRNAYDITGGMMTIDAATGAVVAQISGADVGAVLGEEFPHPWAYMGDWDVDGIHFVPNCYACEGVFTGEWMLWNPQTNAITPATGEYFDIFFGDVLAATGEMLYAGQDTRFPISDEPSYLPIPNVVYYLANEPVPSFEAPTTAPIIYQNPSILDLDGGAHWVLDGDAALVTPESGGWTLIYRDGTQQPVSAVPGQRFLVGMPDGWLTLQEDVLVARYTIAEGIVAGRPVMELLPEGDYVQVVSAPQQGSDLTAPVPFAAVVSAQSLPAPTTSSVALCPNMLTPRLIAGGTGRVTAGLPNRLRAEPNANAVVLGQIPGGSAFVVIDGPVCDEASGFVWWQVNYNSTVGWTAESAGAEYFLEPVGG